MIFKVISNKAVGSFHGIKYNIDKIEKAVLLGKKIISEYIKGVTKMTLEENKKVAEKLMKDLGHKNAPYILVGHNDTKNNHVHTVASRVDMEGKKLE